MASLSTFIEELRRRRVFRVAAFYGGLAIILLSGGCETFYRLSGTIYEATDMSVIPTAETILLTETYEFFLSSEFEDGGYYTFSWENLTITNPYVVVSAPGYKADTVQAIGGKRGTETLDIYLTRN